MSTRSRDSLRLGAALQIGFLKMCGRPLDVIQRVPADLLKHLGKQLEIAAPTIATLRALYMKRRRTPYEHQHWAMEFLGVIRFEPTDTDKLLPSLCDVVRSAVSGDHLLTATRKLLYENRFVIPGTRRLSNLMQSAVSRVEHDALSLIECRIPVPIRNQWLDALSRLGDPERKMTLLEYLQEPPARTHSLQRQIRRDGAGSRRGRRNEEVIAQSGALVLVTNLVMAWNTHHMQATLDRWRLQNREIDPQILHHITPMGFEGINFGGILVFPLARHRSRLCHRARNRPRRWSRKQASLTAC